MDQTAMDSYAHAQQGSPLPGLIVFGLIAILMIASMWRVFSKAGEPGWAAIIPIYNIWILLKIIGRPGWWLALFLLALIPIVGSIIVFVIGIIINLDLAKSYGKSTGFAIGLIILGFIFMPILGFGPARYLGPAAAPGGPPSDGYGSVGY